MKPYFQDSGIDIYHGDALATLRQLPDALAQTCVTSPPYFGLRDYNVDGQIGLEATPEAYITELVGVFREVRRVLQDDGTVWLNIGDSYNAYNGNRGLARGANKNHHEIMPSLSAGHGLTVKGLKSKDLIGIPWMLAFALRADGWYLRQDIIWHKPSPMPESTKDRCTKSHEYIFLLSKKAKYYFDADAIAEDGQGAPTDKMPGGWATGPDHSAIAHQTAKNHRKVNGGASFGKQKIDVAGSGAQSREFERPIYDKRNKRSVWTVAAVGFPGAHFATFPPALIEPCILAGSRPDDIVMDPFNGSGTTGQVCRKWGRRYVGIELNADYIDLSKERFRQGVLFPAGEVA